MNQRYQSWGRFPHVEQDIIPLQWRNDSLPGELFADKSLLPFGNGRSYGDVCLNDQNILLDARPLNHLIAFDHQRGILRCEAGVTLAEILETTVPHGWFLPVTPGTKFVTLGGAIANDVHGKNHHHAGTFGRYINSLELLRSSGERLLCSPTENPELFSATIAGLGLTGVITWAEIQLKKIDNPFIASETIRFANLDEFIQLCVDSDQGYEYTVAWLDCLASGDNLGRGLFMRGNHAGDEHNSAQVKAPAKRLTVPFDAPGFAMHPLFIKAFNHLYYNRQQDKKGEKLGHYDPFFYPLDTIHHWNRIYGRKGFLQYQCVVPYEKNDRGPIKEILKLIADHKQGSFLAVLKLFGDFRSPGMLSFPRPGLTLALDFPNRGEKLFQLFGQLDRLVMQHNGAIYPAKDAHMSEACFKQFYPNWEEFSHYIDPRFSSSFWRRVNGEK